MIAASIPGGTARSRKTAGFAAEMISEQAQQPAVIIAVDVTFAWRVPIPERRECDVPNGGEQGAVAAIAQPVRALAAHARRRGGHGDAASASEVVEEGELAGCPAVASGAAGARSSLLHRAVWSTKPML